SLRHSLSEGSGHLYAPVVITTATLYTCEFDPEKIDLKGGLIEAENAKFASVPFVRFRKSIATNFKRKGQATTYSQANSLNERTILVISSASLADTLKQIGFKSGGPEVYDQFQRLLL